MFGIQKVKKSILVSILTHETSVSFNQILPSQNYSYETAVQIMNGMITENDYQNRSSHMHHCPFTPAGCDFERKQKYLVTAHALLQCEYANRWHEDILALDEKIKELNSNQERNEQRAAEYRKQILDNQPKKRKRRWSGEFRCQDCSFRTNWRSSKKTFIRHHIPGPKYCPNADESHIPEIFNLHPLFNEVRQAHQP